MHKVSVSICSPDLEIADHWSALIARAPANVFMASGGAESRACDRLRRHPHAARVGPGRRAARAAAGRICGRSSACTSRRCGRRSWPRRLTTMRSCRIRWSIRIHHEAIAAFFDAIERERSLPNVIRLRYLDGSAETYPAIMSALAARGAQTLKLAERERPYVHQRFRTEELGLDPQEAAAGLEPADRAWRRRYRQRPDARRGAGRVRNLSHDGSRELEGLRAAPRCSATRKMRPSRAA